MVGCEDYCSSIHNEMFIDGQILYLLVFIEKSLLSKNFFVYIFSK